MEYRTLGKSGLSISAIGLGTEHVTKQSSETVTQTIHLALEAGITYFDILWMNPAYLTSLSAAFRSSDVSREEMQLAVHIGVEYKNGRHRKARSLRSTQQSFTKTLSYLQTEYVDAIIIQNVTEKEYSLIMGSKGLISFAEELQASGCALGISTHAAELALEAATTGIFDFVMSQFNVCSANNHHRKKLVVYCEKNNIGFIAIKPYAGGHLLKTGKKVRIPQLKAGGEAVEWKLPATDFMPARCLSFILSHQGVTSVIPGVKNPAELQQALDYYVIAPQQRDYRSLLAQIE